MVFDVRARECGLCPGGLSSVNNELVDEESSSAVLKIEEEVVPFD